MSDRTGEILQAAAQFIATTRQQRTQLETNHQAALDRLNAIYAAQAAILDEVVTRIAQFTTDAATSSPEHVEATYQILVAWARGQAQALSTAAINDVIDSAQYMGQVLGQHGYKSESRVFLRVARELRGQQQLKAQQHQKGTNKQGTGKQRPCRRG